MHTQANIMGAVFNYDQRVMWDEDSLGMTCTGHIVTPVFDSMGNPTRTFLVCVDHTFIDLVCITPRERRSRWVHKHIKHDNLRVEEEQAVAMW